MIFRLVLAVFFALFYSVAFSAEEPEIRESGFSNKFALRILSNYNFVSFWTSEFHEGALVSNRPVDIGLGVGYKDFYYDFIYALPFTVSEGRSPSLAFETSFNFFPGAWWIEAKYRRYSGFSTEVKEGADSSIFVDLWERDAYISALWMENSEGDFSPQAVYFLDKKQRESAGCIIIGGRLQIAQAKDKSEILPYYAEEREVVSAWTNMGYSYTWIYDKNFFVNLWGVAGVAVRGDDDADFTLLPEVTAKMAFGQINDSWSWNIVLETEYMPVIFSDHWEQKWVSAFKILVVRRL